MTMILILVAVVMLGLGVIGTIACTKDGDLLGFIFSARMIESMLEVLFGLLR